MNQQSSQKTSYDVKTAATAIRSGDRAALGRAISLVESSRLDHQKFAEDLLTLLLPHTGQSFRVGITGVPGVGKSTFIEKFGLMLTAAGHKVAVLAVDPSSEASKGSILGDKTRMENLANDPNAFIRPSPSGTSLGGVARHTREALLLCEAAGYDVAIVETVGVGQSETAVAGMVDFFLLLMVGGTGDELQGIKRGILELADLIAINKADQNPDEIFQAQAHITAAFRYLRPKDPLWKTQILRCSGQSGEGLEPIWQAMQDFQRTMIANGHWQARRMEQLKSWMWRMAEEVLREEFHQTVAVQNLSMVLEPQVVAGSLAATQASRMLVQTYRNSLLQAEPTSKVEG